MGRGTRVLAAVVTALAVVGLARPAAADPLPPFDLDPVKLEARMDACLAYAVGERGGPHGVGELPHGSTSAVEVQLAAAHAG
jgi:hypothetical protein